MSRRCERTGGYIGGVCDEVADHLEVRAHEYGEESFPEKVNEIRHTETGAGLLILTECSVSEAVKYCNDESVSIVRSHDRAGRGASHLALGPSPDGRSAV